jgi:hypothetical protein
MVTSLVGVYTTTKTSLVEHGWKNDMVANMTTHTSFLLGRRVFWRSNFLGNFKPLDKKLDLQRTPT